MSIKTAVRTPPEFIGHVQSVVVWLPAAVWQPVSRCSRCRRRSSRISNWSNWAWRSTSAPSRQIMPRPPIGRTRRWKIESVRFLIWMRWHVFPSVLWDRAKETAVTDKAAALTLRPIMHHTAKFVHADRMEHRNDRCAHRVQNSCSGPKTAWKSFHKRPEWITQSLFFYQSIICIRTLVYSSLLPHSGSKHTNIYKINTIIN